MLQHVSLMGKRTSDQAHASWHGLHARSLACTKINYSRIKGPGGPEHSHWLAALPLCPSAGCYSDSLTGSRACESMNAREKAMLDLGWAQIRDTQLKAKGERLFGLRGLECAPQHATTWPRPGYTSHLWLWGCSELQLSEPCVFCFRVFWVLGSLISPTPRTFDKAYDMMVHVGPYSTWHEGRKAGAKE